jgi:hypothetical protein
MDVTLLERDIADEDLERVGRAHITLGPCPTMPPYCAFPR